MAINQNAYNKKIMTSLWTNKEYDKFLIYFKFKKKKYRKVLDYTYKLWDKKTKINEAKKYLFEMKVNIENEREQIKEISLNDFALNEFSKVHNKSRYQKDKESFYDRYIKNEKIGSMKIHEILKNDITNIIAKNKDFNERRKKFLKEVLNPLFKEAIDNRICLYNPCENISFILPKTKKIILNADEELKKLKECIEELYKEDDYHYCLFMFYLHGRRKSEVLKLEWKNIDLKNDFYVIEDSKNGENQKFYLSSNIKERLSKIPKLNKYIFFSKSKKDDHVKNLTYQVNQIRKYTNTDFKLKDTRNIITSAMGLNGENAIYQSGAVGHKSLKTIDKYSTLNYEVGSKKASDLIDKI